MLSLISAAALSFTPAVAPASDDWYADFDEAVAVAREEGKDLFVDFTGSDWCGWCIKLHDEVFQYDSFLDPVREDYVLVALDFPNGEEAKAAVPNPERNQELSEQYEIRGFPTILVMNPDGDVLAQMGYAAGGPEKYVESMTTQVAAGKQMLAQASELEQAFAVAEGESRLAVIAQAIVVLEKAAEAQTTIGWGRVAPIAQAALALEGEQHEGLKLRAVGALLGGTPDAAMLDMAYGMDATNEKGVYEKALAAQMQGVQDDDTATAFTVRLVEFATTMTPKDSAAAANMMATAAMWNENFLGDHETAVLLANHALKLDPELNPDMAASLKELVAQDEEPVEEEPVTQG